MQARKIYSIAGIVLLALIIIAAAIYAKRIRLQSPLVMLPQSGQVITNTTGQQTQGIDNNISLDSLQAVSGGTATIALNYQDALSLYRGRVIEFDNNCRANPIVMQLAPKSVLMLGNNSQYQRSIAFGDRMYTILPYDYVLASFNTQQTYNVSCDSFKNVAVISVQ